MKRFFRWTLVIVVVLIVVGAAITLVGRNRMRQMPTWYPRASTDAAARRAAANSADQKLIQTFSRAREAQAAEVRARHAAANSSAATTLPAGEPIVIQFSEDELNAFFNKWEQKFGWKQKAGRYIEEPVIVIEGKDLILAGTMKDWNTVVSLHFEPQLATGGKLNLTLAHVMAGTLPLPRSAFNAYAQQLEQSVTAKLPELRKAADISDRGWANGAAVAAAMGELLVHALRDEPAEPVLFLPETTGKESRSLPVRITDVDVSKKTLTLTVEPMTQAERETLLEHLHRAEDAAEGTTPTPAPEKPHAAS